MALLSAHPAVAQSSDVLARIKRMENEIDTLNRAVYKGEPPPPISPDATGAAAQVDARLTQIENDLRNLTGKVEEQTYNSQQLQQRLDAMEQETRRQMDMMRGAQAQQPQQPPPGAIVGNPPMGQPVAPDAPPMGGLPAQDTQTPPMPSVLQNDSSVEVNAPEIAGSSGGADAASLYEQGFAEIKQQNYPAAEASFSKFLKDYPSHALAPNALYWLGETYYVRKEYDKASRTFAEAYQKYPNGPKAADNLLKLGMALSGKGEKESACVALKQLKQQYPQGPGPVLARGDQEMASLGCK